MAGYPKIWTTLLSEPWFTPLSINAKGVYLLLLLEAKRQGDSGDVVFSGWSSLAHHLGGDRSTVANIVRKFQQIGKIVIVEKSARLLHLRIANYKKYQSIKNYRPSDDRPKNVPKNPQQPNKRSEAKHITEVEGYRLIELTRIEQSKFENLKKAYPDINVEKELREADLYWLNQPGKRKDHYRTLLNWIKNGIKYREENAKPESGDRKNSQSLRDKYSAIERN